LLKGVIYSLTFLLSVVTFNRVRSHRARQYFLLLASYGLYLSWSRWFVSVLLASTVMNFLLGQSLRRRARRAVLTAGIILNLALLCSFKYLPELSLQFPWGSFQRFSHIALPLGISFWTFQAMSYLFDLYRGEELDPSLVEFALYMVFFPVAISGPICRMPDMLPQFRSERLTPWAEIGRGLARIATGVFMIQLARLLGQGILGGGGIDAGFDHLTIWSGLDVWCLAFGYALQLFFNFAGYSHIAIGAAQALGFTIPENFARPFLSTTPSVFWTRWHMSLSFWIRDYMFFPLATMYREMWWRTLVLALSMVLFGIWHGATALFLLWGCYHGLLLVLHRQWQGLQRKLNWNPQQFVATAVSWLVTTALISLGWILFRSHSPAQARQMFSAVFSASYSSHFLSGSLYALVGTLAMGYGMTLLVADALAAYPLSQQTSPEIENAEYASSQPRFLLVGRLAIYRYYWLAPLYGLSLLVVYLMTHAQETGGAQFMYRQF
jgi:Predicted membrane protein involved in D-alanine export